MVCLIFSLTSCATLFKGTSENVNFGSNPIGAEVWVDGRMMGKTPVNFRLVTKKTYTIEFRYEGQIKTVNLNNQVGAGWVILDVLAGLVPVVIDIVTGAWYSFDQDNVNVDFGGPGTFTAGIPKNEITAAPQTQALQKAMISPDEIFTVIIANKSFETTGDKEHIWFDVEWMAAKLKKPARSIKGILNFCDLFGEIKFRLEKTLNNPLKPGESMVETGLGFTYDPSNPAYVWMKETELKNMIIKFHVTNILYMDGERKDY